MHALKDQFYNPTYYKQLSKNLHAVDPSIDEHRFYKACTKDLNKLELKQRISHTSGVCRQFFPDNYRDALKILYAYAEQIQSNSFADIFMPDYVARYGTHDFKRSMQALKDFTCYSTSELAIRVFLENDYDRAMTVVKKWSSDKDHHVRRLSSEGTRPRLPWASQVKYLLDHPENNFPILEALKQDEDKYVQKSVANHLNDISKDHPGQLLSLIKKWDRSIDTTEWIIRHGTRTLVKQGNEQTLSLLGINPNPKVKIHNFTLSKSRLALGDSLSFKLKISSLAKTSQKLVVDYKVHYKKSSGKTNPKVFKLKTFNLNPSDSITLQKKHLFKDFTTRKHYSGKHMIEIMVNGKSQKTLSLILAAD